MKTTWLKAALNDTQESLECSLETYFSRDQTELDKRKLETIDKAQMELTEIIRSDPQTLVTEFHAKMGLPVALEPTVGTPEQRCLRVRLMLEEVLEFADAAGVDIFSESGDSIEDTSALIIEPSPLAPDLAQMTHELADVQYVVSGAAVELGLPLREAVPLIHEANMRKEPGNKDAGGKIRKPEGWTPADVSGLLKK